MTAREHLSQLPMYYINLDREVERNMAFLNDTAPVFGSTTRISGVEGWNLPREEVVAFRTAHALHMGKEPPKQWTDKVWRVASGMLGCSRSFQIALRMGLEAGHERFVLCEDDAKPRQEMLDEVEYPGGDLIAWGGVQFAAFSSDDRLFLSGAPQRWKPLDKKMPGAHGFFGMYCLELTPKFAEPLLELMAKEDRFNDWCWNYLWGPEYTAWQSLPQVFCGYTVGNVSIIRGNVENRGYTSREEGLAAEAAQSPEQEPLL